MLWLALQFPRLALDTRPGAEAQSEPLAIIEAQGPRRIVVAATRAADRIALRLERFPDHAALGVGRRPGAIYAPAAGPIASNAW